MSPQHNCANTALSTLGACSLRHHERLGLPAAGDSSHRTGAVVDGAAAAAAGRAAARRSRGAAARARLRELQRLRARLSVEKDWGLVRVARPSVSWLAEAPGSVRLQTTPQTSPRPTCCFGPPARGPPARDLVQARASTRSSSGRPPASASLGQPRPASVSLGQLVDLFCPAGHDGLSLDAGTKRCCCPSLSATVTLPLTRQDEVLLRDHSERAGDDPPYPAMSKASPRARVRVKVGVRAWVRVRVSVRVRLRVRARARARFRVRVRGLGLEGWG